MQNKLMFCYVSWPIIVFVISGMYMKFCFSIIKIISFYFQCFWMACHNTTDADYTCGFVLLALNPRGKTHNSYTDDLYTLLSSMYTDRKLSCAIILTDYFKYSLPTNFVRHLIANNKFHLRKSM